jgi:hypothetical protein
LLVGAGITVLTGFYGREYNWPDYHHIEYGLPAVWLIRTLSTIAGPADRLDFQLVGFAIDLIFWWILSFISLVAPWPRRLMRA